MQSSPRQFRAVVNEGFKVPVCPLTTIVTVYCACAVSVHAVVVGNLWMFAKFIHTRREIRLRRWCTSSLWRVGWEASGWNDTGDRLLRTHDVYVLSNLSPVPCHPNNFQEIPVLEVSLKRCITTNATTWRALPLWCTTFRFIIRFYLYLCILCRFIGHLSMPVIWVLLSCSCAVHTTVY